MQNYQETLKQHLAHYAQTTLKLTELGVWRGRPYAHILPEKQKWLNFLPLYRAEIQRYLEQNPTIKLHQYFHHLSSSQAFAFNLFFPFFSTDAQSARRFFRHFDSGLPKEWAFEFVPDQTEGTNVDVWWTESSGAAHFCEVKLTEGEFGTATDDARHRQKLEQIYRPRLSTLVPSEFLTHDVFFANYQILRNISLLHDNPANKVSFLMPQANEGLTRQLAPILAGLNPGVRARINLIYIEALVGNVKDDSEDRELHAYLAALSLKYIPTVLPTTS